MIESLMLSHPLFKTSRASIANTPHPEACIDRAKAFSGLPYALRKSSDDYLNSELLTFKVNVVHHYEYVPSGLTKESLELALESPVTPLVASKLIEIYRQGHLYTSGKKPGKVQDWLVAYAASPQDEVLKKSFELWHRDFEKADLEEANRRLRLKEEKARLRNFEVFAEKDFSYSLLNSIFWENLGKGDGRLVIGGVTVTKSVNTYTSNSGKSRSSEVQFSWTSLNGEPKSLLKESAYSNNRRNDEGRNWGLPE